MIFQASLANAQILIPSSQGGVSSILLEGRTLLALATTVYGPGGIDQVLPGAPDPPCPAAPLSCPCGFVGKMPPEPHVGAEGMSRVS